MLRLHWNHENNGMWKMPRISFQFKISLLTSLIISWLSYRLYFCPKHTDTKIFENHLNPVMLVFIGKKDNTYGRNVDHNPTHNSPSNTSCINPFTLRVPLESIVCYSHTYEHNLGIKLRFTKYLKESCCMASDQHFSFKYFPENTFVSKIFSKLPGLFWPLWV